MLARVIGIGELNRNDGVVGAVKVFAGNIKGLVKNDVGHARICFPKLELDYVVLLVGCSAAWIGA